LGARLDLFSEYSSRLSFRTSLPFLLPQAGEGFVGGEVVDLHDGKVRRNSLNIAQARPAMPVPACSDWLRSRYWDVSQGGLLRVEEAMFQDYSAQ